MPQQMEDLIKGAKPVIAGKTFDLGVSVEQVH